MEFDSESFTVSFVEVVAAEAVPVNAAVIVPALKLPDASLLTILFAVFPFVALVTAAAYALFQFVEVPLLAVTVPVVHKLSPIAEVTVPLVTINS